MTRLIFFLLSGVIIVAALFFGLSPQKQADSKSIFTSDEVVFFGLDFTKAHCVGVFDQGFGVEPANSTELRDVWIPAWNSLMAAEQSNFDLKRAFRKKYVYYDLASVNQLNSQLNPAELLNFNETKITNETIQEMVKKYTSSEKKGGLGLSLVVENFNKNTQMASFYITFFDIETKKVLLAEYEVGHPVGFGLRNYWAGAIKEVLMKVELFEYQKWKKKYYDNSTSSKQTTSSSSVDKLKGAGVSVAVFPLLKNGKKVDINHFKN